MKPIMHLFDADRTVLDGERTKCGRHVRWLKLKWTYGYVTSQKPPYNMRKVRVTCKACLRVAKATKKDSR